MKNKLFYITNQHGFFLPYVLFIVSLTFIIISTNIKIYSNEIDMMNHLTEQIKIETLLNMGRTKFTEDMMHNKNVTDTILYSFPSGDVQISYVPSENEQNKIFVYYQITTNQGFTFSLNDFIQLNTRLKTN